jgi:TolA-binding protein
MRTALLILLSAGALCAAEPSAFGAGDLDSPNPYGLTESEKHILKNKQTLDAVRQKSRSTESQVGSLRERIDGMQSVVEGLNGNVHDNRQGIDDLKAALTNDRSEHRESLQQLEAVVKSNEQNVLQLKKVLEEFSGMLDTINGNYVSKDEYNTLVQEINTFKKEVAKALKQRSVSAKSVSGGGLLDKMSNGEVAAKALELYERERYTQAIEYYEHLIRKKYKPARAHYMIGEMWYARKDYGQAIAYFKKSAQLYGKADYMPTLMLHTAISMQATKDIANAKKFYSGVVAQYPGSEEAATAASRLRKLK